MSIYNPSVSLPSVSNGKSFAKLSRIDGKGSYDFLVNPITLKKQYSAKFNKIAVIHSSLERLNYQSSNTVISLPDVRFYTRGGKKSLQKVLDGLAAMTRPVKEGDWLPVCKFIWGTEVYNACYLSEFDITISQMIGDQPTEAEGSMTLLVLQEKTNLVMPETETFTTLTAKEVVETKNALTASVLKSDTVLNSLPTDVKTAYGSTLKRLKELKAQAKSGKRFIHINVKADGSGEAIAGSIDNQGKQLTDTRLPLPRKLLEHISPKAYKRLREKTLTSKIE